MYAPALAYTHQFGLLLRLGGGCVRQTALIKLPLRPTLSEAAACLFAVVYTDLMSMAMDNTSLRTWQRQSVVT